MAEASNAFVLSGGGILGAFQAGAISAVIKQQQFVPSGIFGSSAGALNGAFLADRAGRQMSETGRIDWPKLGDDLVQFWLDRITGPDALWEARGELEVARQICRDNFRGVIKTDATPPKKLYRNIVREEIKKENLEGSGLNYHAGAVDLFSGKIEFPGSSDPDIVELIIASSAIPIAMDVVDIPRAGASVPFADGGTRDVAPLSRAVENDYTNIVCIVCQSQNLTSRNFPPRTLKRLMGRLMSIIINETVNNDLQVIDRYKTLLKNLAISVEALDKTFIAYNNLQCVTIIRPDVELDYDDMDFTRDDIREMIAKGAAAATEGLTNRFRSLQDVKQLKPMGSFKICWEFPS